MKSQIAVYTQNLRFEWSGGVYIGVFNARHTEPHDVINVWDYRSDERRIRYTPDAMVEAIEAWLAATDSPESVKKSVQIDDSPEGYIEDTTTYDVAECAGCGRWIQKDDQPDHACKGESR